MELIYSETEIKKVADQDSLYHRNQNGVVLMDNSIIAYFLNLIKKKIITETTITLFLFYKLNNGKTLSRKEIQDVLGYKNDTIRIHSKILELLNILELQRKTKGIPYTIHISEPSQWVDPLPPSLQERIIYILNTLRTSIYNIYINKTKYNNIYNNTSNISSTSSMIKNSSKIFNREPKKEEEEKRDIRCTPNGGALYNRVHFSKKVQKLLSGDKDWKKAKKVLLQFFSKKEVDTKRLKYKDAVTLMEVLMDSTFNFFDYCKWYSEVKYPTKGFVWGLFLYPSMLEEYNKVSRTNNIYLKTTSRLQKNKNYLKDVENTNKFLNKFENGGGA